MSIPVYVVDAFAEKIFTGNPAAVCPLEEWLEDGLLQRIAAEHNLAETAFIVREGDGYRVRWFTPKAEVDLCGHATLAGAHVLFDHLGYDRDEIVFQSRSGPLKVRRDEGGLTLDFPTDTITAVDVPDFLIEAFGRTPVAAFRGNCDYLLIFENQRQIEEARPILDLVAKSGTRGAIISAPGDEADFVSRYFAPQYGIDEDPATGSAHTTMIPYWHSRTGKARMKAVQLSERRGHFSCLYLGDRVEIGGKAFTYSIGSIML